jgi:SEL1 protein
LDVDANTAAEYARRAAVDSSTEYHRAGKQPFVESQIIDENTVRNIAVGEMGLNDEQIQHQKLRAAEGDLPSILAMGDLFYYGARGLPRDHGVALDYYMRGATMGNPSAMCGAASMIIKDEGLTGSAASPKPNITTAIELFEKAAALEDVHSRVRAFNGLGFLFFYGKEGIVAKNLTKAFEYFDQAAATFSDGDSLHNAAVCLEHGIGTPVNLKRAIEYYTAAAKQFGHFDSIKAMGDFFMQVRRWYISICCYVDH